MTARPVDVLRVNDPEELLTRIKGVLCHADTTLHPVVSLNDHDKIVDGNALWHICPDSSILADWALLSGTPHTVRATLTLHPDFKKGISLQKQNKYYF